MVAEVSFETSPATQRQLNSFGGDSVRVIPVPIPNTEVKPDSADGTWDVSPWESRTPPDFYAAERQPHLAERLEERQKRLLRPRFGGA